MNNDNPKMVEIIFDKDKIHFKFRCKVCKQEWLPSQKPKKASEIFGTGDFYSSCWQCPNGCKAKDLKE